MEEEKTLPISISPVVARTVSAGLTTLSFAIPFALGHSQFLTGSLVNAALFSAAIFLPEKLLLPIIFMPGLAVLTRGMIFGPLTPFLFPLLPLIWTGNLILVVVFKRFFPKVGFSLAIFPAALVKSLILYLSASLLFNFQIIPRMFLQTMGINQLITAILGGFLVLIALRPIYHE